MTTQNDSHDSLNAALHEIEQKAVLGAEAIAWKRLPLAVGDSFAPYWEEMHFHFQKLLDMGNLTLDPKSTLMKAGKASREAEKDNHAIIGKLPELETKRNNVTTELESIRLSPRTKKWYRILIIVGVVLVCLADALYNLPTFEAWGLSYIEALILSIVFGASLAFFAHVYPHIVALGKTLWQRRIFAFGLLAMAFSIFLFFGEMRAEYLAKQASENGATVHYSGLPFALVSMLLLIIAIAIPYFFNPSKAQMEDKRRHETLSADKKKIEDEIAGIGRQRKANDAAKDMIHSESGTQLNTGYSNEQRIIAHAMMTFSLFKKTNLIHRDDGVKPQSFNEVYPFSFTTYFNFDNHHTHNTLPA